MGYTHAISTSAFALAVSQPLAELTGNQLSAPSAIALAVVAGGFGVLPDVDHPQATLARVLGPVTKMLATVVSKAAGGHRKGTHTIWFAIGVTALSAFLTSMFGVRAEIPIVFVGSFLMFLLLKITPREVSWLGELVYLAEASAATYLVVTFVPGAWWIPWSVGIGVIGHIIGDSITTEGVPVFYPLFPKVKLRLPILGHTGSVRETWFGVACGFAAVWIGVAIWAGADWWTSPGTWLH